MRALILALISSHYFHTASEHAEMLRTCDQLAAGLGAAGTKEGTGKVGNAQMRLWVGERFLGKSLRTLRRIKLTTFHRIVQKRWKGEPCGEASCFE
jgi:hypothetical protein